MGGGDWAEKANQQYEQIQRVYKQAEMPAKKVQQPKAISTPAPLAETATSVQIKEPDFGDHVYVWLRTRISGEFIMVIFAFGVFTLVGHRFRKQIKAWLRGVLSD